MDCSPTTPPTPPTNIEVNLRQNIDILDESDLGKVCFGDKVWEDMDRDGVQDTDEIGIENVKVTLYTGDCISELNVTQTDTLGEYMFSNLESGDYCVGFSEFPSEYEDYIATFKNRGSDRDRDSDVNRDTNKTDRFTLNSIENSECNISIDMGIYKKRECKEIMVYDDIQDSNQNSSITEINILSNDTLPTDEQTVIKLLNTSDGEILWHEDSIVPSTVELLDTLVVEGEGIWQVENGIIKFTAFDEFDGQIPSVIYYTVETLSCDEVVDSETRLSNVAQIKLSSPCSCTRYTNSVSAFNKISIIIFIILIFWFIKIEFKKDEYLSYV